MDGRWLVVRVLMAAICLQSCRSQVMVNITNPLKGNVGGMLVIECSVFVLNDDGTVTFDEQSNIVIRRDGTVFGNSRLTSSTVDTKKTYTLRDLTREDAGGPMLCAAAEFLSAEVNIEICYAPEITSAGVVTVAEGGVATLDFTIDASPPPTVPNTIRPSSSSSVPSSLSVDGNSVVVSTSVSRSDNGQYLFVSENSVGESSVEFTLDVQYPPTFTSTVSGEFSCNTSTSPITCASFPEMSGTLSCDFDSNPDGTLQMIFVVGDSSSVITGGGNFSISSTGSGNAGSYTCVATNSIQGQSITTRREITFYVGELPTAVMNVTANNMSENVIIEWTYTQEEGAIPLMGFSLKVKLYGSTTTTIPIQEISPEARNFVLSSSIYMLEPGEKYVATIKAVNLLGEGEARDIPFITPPTTTPTTTPSSSGQNIDSCVVLLLQLSTIAVLL